MKLSITLGCLLLALAGFAQQNHPTAVSNSPTRPDSMPVIRSTGNPVPMPTRKGAGTAVDMPTHRMEAFKPASPQGPVLPEGLLKDWGTDSTNRISPRKKDH